MRYFIGGPGQKFCRREFETGPDTGPVTIAVTADAHSYVNAYCQKLRSDGNDGTWLMGGSFIKYHLFLDGKRLGIGPFRGIRSGERVEHVFPAGKLAPGRHAVACLIRAEQLGVAVEIRANGQVIADSASAFRQCSANDFLAPVCWTHPEISSYFKGDIGPGELFEHFQGEFEPDGWLNAGFDDSSWEECRPAQWEGIPENAEWNYQIEQDCPERIVTLGNGSFLIDFGREAIAQIEMTVPEPAYVELRLGEELLNDKCVRFQLRADTCYQELWHFARSGQTLSHFGVRSFRYAEVHGFPGELNRENFRRRVIHAPFQSGAVHFVSSSPELNRIWDLCRYTVKATAMDLYTDCFTRERICYEADAYVNMLANFAVDSAAPAARRSVGYMITHPTWPCEWMQMMIPVFYEYYMHTADAEMIRANWEDLIRKASYLHLLENGLVKRFPLEIIVDWPAELRDGCEIDADYVAIPHFLLYGNLRKLAFLAKEIGKEDCFTSAADAMLPVIRSAFWNPERRLFVDHRGSRHSSLHTNVWALWNQVASREDSENIVDFIVSKGMACGVCNAQYVLDVLFEYGHAEQALALLLDDGPHSWRNMLNMGATITTEAWNCKQKANMSWAHPWGASPAHAIVRHLCGLKSALPGWKQYHLNPKAPGGIQFTLDYTLPNGHKIHYSTIHPETKGGE